MAERVQKILARAGVASRRASEDLIRAGRVTVNGRIATLGASADPTDAIKVDGKRIVLPTRDRYVLLNKPKGYITSKSDPEGRRTVMELVPAAWRKGLGPVGRLDFNTEGLLLLTTDGGFAQQVIVVLRAGIDQGWGDSGSVIGDGISDFRFPIFG